MSDLVKRLRAKYCCTQGCTCGETADRIEELERELAARQEAEPVKDDLLAMRKACDEATGDPARYPRRGIIDRYHSAVVAAYERGDLVALRAQQPAPQVKAQTPAARGVLAERQRQISAEGWTPEHDDQHSCGEMAKAAGCYAWLSAQSLRIREVFGSPPPTWPTEWSAGWWKPTTQRRDLVKAGALILAEIERLDRAAALSGEAQP